MNTPLKTTRCKWREEIVRLQISAFRNHRLVCRAFFGRHFAQREGASGWRVDSDYLPEDRPSRLPYFITFIALLKDFQRLAEVCTSSASAKEFEIFQRILTQTSFMYPMSILQMKMEMLCARVTFGKRCAAVVNACVFGLYDDYRSVPVIERKKVMCFDCGAFFWVYSFDFLRTFSLLCPFKATWLYLEVQCGLALISFDRNIRWPIGN